MKMNNDASIMGQVGGEDGCYFLSMILAKFIEEQNELVSSGNL